MGGGLRERRAQKAPFFWECEAPKERKKGTTKNSVLVEDARRLFGLNFRTKCKADGVRHGISAMDLPTVVLQEADFALEERYLACVIASNTL